MQDKEIKEMFVKKNKAIIKNKLVLDLKNNIDSLLATILNITYLEFGIYKEKVLLFKQLDALSINKIIEKYEKFLKSLIESEIKRKKTECINCINNIDFDKGLGDYKDILDTKTRKISDNLNKKVLDYIDEYVISSLITSSWYVNNNNQVDFLIVEKLGKDLINKINLQMKDRDIIIFNNARESYEKYLILNENIK